VTEMLTPTEQRVLQVVCGTIRKEGHLPSLEQIMELAQLPSPASAHYFMDNLQRKGVIHRDAARPGVIEVYCSAIGMERAELAHTMPSLKERGKPETGEGRRQTSVVDPPAGEEVPVQEPPTAPIREAETVDSSTAPSGNHIETPDGRIFGRGVRPGGTDQELAIVPLLGHVAAGQPIEAPPGEIEAIYQLPRAFVGHEDPLFMVRVRGASMLDEGIHEDDLLVVHRQSHAEVGQTVVVLDENDDAAVKGLWRSEDGSVELRSANPAFGPLEVAQAQIIGRVVTVIRAL
jgi:SOS regulatory protein LexA